MHIHEAAVDSVQYQYAND